jgi:hypothetical protein
MMTNAFEKLLADLSEAEVDYLLKEESLRPKDQMDVQALRRIQKEQAPGSS